jgi:hypothetical protein
MDNGTIATLLYIAGAVMLVLYIARRRKRKLLH